MYNIMRVVKNLGEEADYVDYIEYSENTIEIAYRRGSLEVNYSNPTVYALRLMKNFKWYIKSSTDPKRLIEDASAYVRFIEYAKYARDKNYSRPNIYNKYLAVGKYSLVNSKGIDENKGIDILQSLRNIVYDYSKGVADLECILIHSLIRRSITPYATFSTALEEKSIIELYINIIYNGGFSVISSDSIGFLGGLEDITLSMLRKRVIKLVERAKALQRAQRLGVLDRGLKHNVVLDPTCSASLFHEVVHLLEADSPSKIKLGTKIFSDEVTLTDDPTLPWGYASSLFDDECVVTKPKRLIENGYVVDYLHIIETANPPENYPGNARGLFHKPKALQSNIIVRPGDWKVDEMVKEARRGFYVEGLIRAEIDNYGNITIIPEVAWSIEKGELKRAVKISYLKLSLANLRKAIIGLGREVQCRVSYEKTHRVSEYAPPILLSGVFIV